VCGEEGSLGSSGGFFSWTCGPAPGAGEQGVPGGKLVAVSLVAVIVGIVIGYAIAVGGGQPQATTVTVEKPVTTTATATETVTTTTVSTTTVARTVPVTSTTSVVRTVTSVATRTQQVLVLTDALGRTVEIPAPPRRVASLAPSITEELVMLGLADRIVAADSYSLKLPGVPAGAADVGGFWNPGPEKILAARPDLVLACAGARPQERLARVLEENGVRVFFLRCDEAKTWSDIEWDVSTLGAIMGATGRAEQLNRWITSSVEALRNQTGNLAHPKVALAVYLDKNGVWVAGGGTFQDTVLQTAGAVNAFHRLYGWQMISYEQLLAENPDYIIAAVSGPKAAANKTLAGLPQPLRETKAYQAGHVCVAYNGLIDALNRPSPRAVLAAWALAEMLHPGKVHPPPSLAKEIPTTWLCNSPTAGHGQG
jgi:iron complex transport system substrate-binding protein